MKRSISILTPICGLLLLTMSGGTSAQAPPKDCPLEPSRNIRPDEDCSEFVVGQFYFKICYEEEKTRFVDEEYWKWEKCVVYDPVKCCNIIVKKKVKKIRKVEEAFFEPVERVCCKQLKVRLDEIENLPDCPCDISEFMSSTTKPSKNLEVFKIVSATKIHGTLPKPTESIADRRPAEIDRSTAKLPQQGLSQPDSLANTARPHQENLAELVHVSTDSPAVAQTNQSPTTNSAPGKRLDCTTGNCPRLVPLPAVLPVKTSAAAPLAGRPPALISQGWTPPSPAPTFLLHFVPHETLWYSY